MALNFLKRKKTLQPSILLYHNLNRKEVPAHLMDTSAARQEDKQKLCLVCPGPTAHKMAIQQPEQTYGVELPSTSSNPEPVEDIAEMLAGESAAAKNWEKAKEHIEKLLFEISDSQNCDNLSRQRTATMTELLDDKTNKPKQDELSESPSQEESIHQSGSSLSSDATQKQDDSSGHAGTMKACSKQKRYPEHDSSKPPLDIQELRTIAAMAKRLRAHSKIKSPSMTDKK